jgi:hypothetical protein
MMVINKFRSESRETSASPLQIPIGYCPPQKKESLFIAFHTKRVKFIGVKKIPPSFCSNKTRGICSTRWALKGSLYRV